MAEKSKMIKLAPATRKVAKAVFSTIKKIGSTKGVTLQKIHDYIKCEYPNTPTNMVRLSNTLEKALAFGAVDKKNNRYVLGGLLKCLTGCGHVDKVKRQRKATLSINKLCRSCKRGRRRGRGRRRRSRSRRRRSRSRRRGGRRRRR